MNTDRKQALPSTTADSAAVAWPSLPTETDIYILPDGRVVIADLPAELVALAAQLGVAEPCAVMPLDDDSTFGFEMPSPE